MFWGCGVLMLDDAHDVACVPKVEGQFDMGPFFFVYIRLAVGTIDSSVGNTWCHMCGAVDAGRRRNRATMGCVVDL